MRSLLWLLLVQSVAAGLPVAAGLLTVPLPAFAQPDPTLEHMAGTEALVMDEPLDVVMVRGINYFAERELADSPNRRAAKWNRDYSSPEAYQKSIEPNRQRLREIIGAVDEREFSIPSVRIDLDEDRSVYNAKFTIDSVRWNVLPGVTAEGVLIRPRGFIAATLIVIPDPDSDPASLLGLAEGTAPADRIAERFAASQCQVLVPTLLNRSDEFSGHVDVRFTNQPHREFIYRMAFEMGRHVIGYEVQKILAAVDWIETGKQSRNLALSRKPEDWKQWDSPVLVAGVGEGGLIALCATAVDPRIDGAMVSGYFQQREDVWREPIYRNVWNQLTEFGDAEIASLIAPRPVVIEACAVPEVSGPPAPRDGRSGGAAPGRIAKADVASVRREFELARFHYEQLQASGAIGLVESDGGTGPAFSLPAVEELVASGKLKFEEAHQPGPSNLARYFGPVSQQRQVDELNRFTQRLMHSSDKARDKVWAKVDRTSIETATKSLNEYREWVYDTLIGRLPEPTSPLNPRTRKVIDEPTHVGYEVVLDLFPAGGDERPMPADAKDPLAVDKDFFAVGKDWGVIAGGILLIPKDLKPGEKRPVVVCQHGLEGTPMSTIGDESHPDYHYYKGFATELCKRGFITYAPQNPYRGKDAFRQIQRKSNPMGRSLFSYIIPQHQRTLEFLASLPYVDASRMGFYGLSYGGKTAVRVPPMLVSTDSKPGYALSICSADYNEWVRKNASSEDRYSYVFTGEYEIFEWNMGHVANYAELSYLMTPRPFMVERGHGDGVAPDEWVAWEFAKVKRHYDQLGIGDKTELEVFNGPHTINGVGTYDFLHRHLEWPAR
jgi:hypothetical protein